MKPNGPSSSRPVDASFRLSALVPSPTFAPRLPQTLAFLGAGLSLGAAGQAGAATFTVTNLNDAGAGSLRQAIEDANAAAGADSVDFQAGLTGTITLSTGQLQITDSVIVAGPGPAALSVSGGNSSRVFYLYNSGSTLDVTISGLTVTGGAANIGAGLVNFDENLVLQDMLFTGNASTGDGGALWLDGFDMNVTMTDVEISGNTAGDDGGGIYVEDTGGPMLLQNVRVSGNTATGQGGGIYFYDPDNDVTLQDSTISGNSAGGTGGGIYFYSADAGAFLITGTTISGNQAPAGGGAFFYGVDQPFAIENSTVSGNAATAGDGGGIYFYSLYGTVEVRHSTIADNSATGAGGGLFVVGEDELVLRHTIVADNAAPADADLGGGSATFAAAFSLIEAASTATITDNGGNVFSQDPQLEALADNGGPTQTQRPATTSPAFNAGDAAFAPPPATDQRGLPRSAAGRIDIGAVELQTGTLAFAAPNTAANESDGTVSITVTRTGGSEGQVSIDAATLAGSAADPADFLAAGGTLTFAEGDVEETFVVTLVDDCAVEAAESFTATLNNPVGALLGAPQEHTVNLASEDAPGTLQFSTGAYNANETDGSVAITVTRVGGTGDAVSANYATSDGSAIAPGDYAATAGTVNFACGDATPQVFNVPIVNDTDVEAAETVNLALSNPAGGAALGAQAAAVLTIASEDAPPGALGFSAAVTAVNETDGTVTLTVSRNGGSSGQATIDFATANGTATAGSDYTATAGTLTFVDGDTEETIVVPLLDDCDVEAPETFTVTLSNPNGAGAGAILVNTVTLASEDAAGTLQFSSNAYTAAEGSGGATITVTRTGGTGGAVSVNYATANGSATAGSDYTATAGTLNFACGSGAAQDFVVPFADDGVFESDETVTLTLSAPGGGAALGAPASAVVTLGNDDATPISAVTIDATGDGSKLMLGGLLALLGVLALRRRGLAGLLLACGLAWGALPAPALAGERAASVGQVTAVQRDGGSVQLVMADGSRIGFDGARVQVDDRRGARRPAPRPNLDAIAAGTWVRIVRKPAGPKGRHEEVKIVLFDSRERAEHRNRDAR